MTPLRALAIAWFTAASPAFAEPASVPHEAALHDALAAMDLNAAAMGREPR